MTTQTMTKPEAFDVAFRPTGDQIDRLVDMCTELFPHVPGRPEMMRVGGHLVSEEYCGICRSDGPCFHKDDLEGLLRMADAAEDQEQAHLAAVGMG